MKQDKTLEIFSRYFYFNWLSFFGGKIIFKNRHEPITVALSDSRGHLNEKKKQFRK